MLALINKFVEYLGYFSWAFGPFYLMRFRLTGQGTINVLDLILALFMLFFGWEKWRERGGGKGRWNKLKKYWRNNQRLLKGVLLIQIGVGLSFLLNATPTNWTDSAGALKSFYWLPLLAALALVQLIKEGRLDLSRLFQIYLIPSTLIAGGSLWYWLQGRLTYDGRLAFIFDSPNQLAMNLALGLLIGAYFLKNSGRADKAASRICSLTGWGLVALMHGLALAVTQSRGAWLGAGAGLLFLFWPVKLAALRQKLFYPALLGTAALVFAALLASGPLLDKIGYSPFLNRSSADSRLVIYRAGAKIAGDHGLFGIGAGNFQAAYLNYQQYFPPYPQWAVPHPHNLWLTLWLETGLLGLVGWLFWLAGLPGFFKKISGAAGINLLTGTLISYFLIHGLIDTPFLKNDLALVFWLVMAIGLLEKGKFKCQNGNNETD